MHVQDWWDFFGITKPPEQNLQKDLLVQQPAGIILQNLWPNSLIPFHLKQPQRGVHCPLVYLCHVLCVHRLPWPGGGVFGREVLKPEEVAKTQVYVLNTPAMWNYFISASCFCSAEHEKEVSAVCALWRQQWLAGHGGLGGGTRCKSQPFGLSHRFFSCS